MPSAPASIHQDNTSSRRQHLLPLVLAASVFVMPAFASSARAEGAKVLLAVSTKRPSSATIDRPLPPPMRSTRRSSVAPTRGRCAAPGAGQAESAKATRAALASVKASQAALVAQLGALRKQLHQTIGTLAAPSAAEPRPAPLLQQVSELRANVARLTAAMRTSGPRRAAQPSKVPDAELRSGGQAATVGLSIEVELSSIYNDRGTNAFASASQHDQHALLSPRISYAIGNTGLTVGYGAVFQWTGDNQSELVASGVGHEQNFAIAYERSLPASLILAAGLTYIFYPFASQEGTGTRWPSVLEPTVALTHSSFIDVQVALTYSIGVQDALASGRFLYVRPALGKSISVHRRATLDIALGVGFKVYNHPDENPDRDIDVGFDVELPLALTSTFFVKPGVHVAWTNLDGASVGDETMVWGNVIVGVKL